MADAPRFSAAFFAVVLVTLCVAPARAAPGDQGVPAAPPATWIDDGVGDLRHSGAGIAVPRSLGDLNLLKVTDAFGNGLDTAVTYGSADTGVVVTVFIYAPAVPDGATIAAAGKSIIPQSFDGAKVERDEGQSDGVRRIIFGGDRIERVNGLAIARRGAWIVSIRVTGTEYRRRETLETFDRVVAKILPNSPTTTARDWTLPAACKEKDKRADARVSRLTQTDGMLHGVLMNGVLSEDPKLRAPWPDTSIAQYCVDTAPPGFPAILLRGAPASAGHQATQYLALVGDAGALLEIARSTDPSFLSKRVTAKVYLVDRISLLELYDDWPSRRQVDGLLATFMEKLRDPIISAKRDRVGPFSTIELNSRLIGAQK